MSTLKVQKIAQVRAITAASPDYLRHHGTPTHHDQLKQPHAIIDTNRTNSDHWQYSIDGQIHDIHVAGPFRVNAARAAAELAIQGHGIAHGLEFLMKHDIANGRLTQILAEYTYETMPLSAV